ncbi:MAG: polyphosphate:AMP phosphotransferase [Myxococcota bacterium]
MFEMAELGQTIDKATFEAEAAKLRQDLLTAQYKLLSRAESPLLILIGGVDGAGKGETVNILNAWMDPRHIQTHAFGEPSDEERERPEMWRFWRVLPPKGKIGIFFGHWYTRPILDRVYGETKNSALDRRIDQINRFEEMLVADGVVLLKFWFHLSMRAQKKRLRALEANPSTRWRVTATDWERFAMYETFRQVSEHTLRRSSPAHAPWIIVEGNDPNFRYLTVARTVHQTLERCLDERPKEPSSTLPRRASVGNTSVLDELDYSKTLDKKRYDAQLEESQGQLNLLTRRKKFQKRSLILVFEGADAAGKGGTIRRITGALDARHYTIIPVAAPTQEERAQPYLWRFWRQLPRRGRVTIFDRSWYGRVLVERVERFATEGAWSRAYEEINDFEEQLTENGAIVMKFWLAISQDEQLRRFQEREATPFKRFKITEEDWRNRERWNDYAAAVSDMVERTSTEIAPWILVPSGDKNFARIRVLRAICRRLEDEL